MCGRIYAQVRQSVMLILMQICLNKFLGAIESFVISGACYICIEHTDNSVMGNGYLFLDSRVFCYIQKILLGIYKETLG